jgi:ubiquinone/menaquinone biosynthesis C-methylase UbiE
VTDYSLAVSQAEIRRYSLMAERAQASESDLWEQAGIVPGAVVADVGCGPAAVSVRIAKIVGPSGRVIGIEPDPAALAAAHQMRAQAGIDNLELRQGTATDPSLEPDTLDVAVLRHVLAHNRADEQQIVDRLAGLARPGGSVYLVDVDATAVRLLDADPEIADLYQKYFRFHQARGNDLLVGLRLGQLLARAGLDVIAHEGHYLIGALPPGVRPPAWAARDSMLADRIATPEDITRWEAAFERMDNLAVRPTAFAPNFIGIGRKPQ